MKGRTNYLCLHRFDRPAGGAVGLPADERRWLARIAEWAAVTDTGDRAEIDDLPDDLAALAGCHGDGRQCLGRDCPQYADCFVTRMRERAAEADIVIVNHHLLCADASVRKGGFGEVIPECELAVIDEAHQLEDVVTQYFGVALGTHRIGRVRARRRAHAGAHCRRRTRRWRSVRPKRCADVQQTGRRLFDRHQVRSAAGPVQATAPR